jgi:hypothetical protein
MMSRTQISLDTELQRRARQRASELGISLAEYLRRLVTSDLSSPPIAPDVTRVFDLGGSLSSDIARNRNSMLADAFSSTHRRSRTS